MRSLTLAAVIASLVSSTSFGGVVFTGAYSQDFDSMGSGTAAPSGWRHFTTSFGSNSTWTSSIAASGSSGVSAMSVTTAGTTLVATTAPSGTQNNGFNAGVGGSTTNRAIGTSPTTRAGAMIQLDLDNGFGSTLQAGSSLDISFDTIRFTAATAANELPGYWLFYSLDSGITWTNVGINPTLANVPNTVGTSSSSFALTLGADWQAGATMYLRWVDDNADQTSPDQILGLDNVVITPAPGAIALLGLAAGLVGRGRRRA
jgi:hypothetical protein